MYNIKQFFKKCHNVWRWLPVIWKDRDWDHGYIHDILIKKLEHQRDFFLSDKPYVARAKETAEQIQTAIDKLNKSKDVWDYYENPFMDGLDEKWGKGVMRFEPAEELCKGCSEMHIDHENVRTAEDNAQYSKEFKEGMLAAHKQYKKDKREAYKYLADHIDYWWD